MGWSRARIEEHLQDALDGRLAPEEERLFRAGLEEHADLAREFRALQDLRARLAAIGMEKAPPEVLARVSRTIRSERDSVAAEDRFSRWGHLSALGPWRIAAMLVMAVVVTGVLLKERPWKAEPSSAGAVEKVVAEASRRQPSPRTGELVALSENRTPAGEEVAASDLKEAKKAHQALRDSLAPTKKDARAKVAPGEEEWKHGAVRPESPEAEKAKASARARRAAEPPGGEAKRSLRVGLADRREPRSGAVGRTLLQVVGSLEVRRYGSNVILLQMAEDRTVPPSAGFVSAMGRAGPSRFRLSTEEGAAFSYLLQNAAVLPSSVLDSSGLSALTKWVTGDDPRGAEPANRVRKEDAGVSRGRRKRSVGDLEAGKKGLAAKERRSPPPARAPAVGGRNPAGEAGAGARPEVAPLYVLSGRRVTERFEKHLSQEAGASAGRTAAPALSFQIGGGEGWALRSVTVRSDRLKGFIGSLETMPDATLRVLHWRLPPRTPTPAAPGRSPSGGDPSAGDEKSRPIVLKFLLLDR